MESFQIKRIQSEIKDFHKDPPQQFWAEPLSNDIRIWHFTFRGLADTDYEGGIYHGTIELDSEYPMKPPNIYFLNQNGRFQTNTRVCLNITKFHTENWDPSINIRSIINAIINHFPFDDTIPGIGSLKMSKNQRQIFAQKSVEYNCQHCGMIKDIIPQNENIEQKQQEAQQNQQIVQSEDNNQSPNEQEIQSIIEKQEIIDINQSDNFNDQQNTDQQSNIDQIIIEKQIINNEQMHQTNTKKPIKLDFIILTHEVIHWFLLAIIIYIIIFY